MRVPCRQAFVVPLAQRRRGVVEHFWLDFLKKAHQTETVLNNWDCVYNMYLEGSGRLENRHALARLFLRR